MGFRGKLPPFFFMSLIQILDSHCILWWTLNRQIKKEDLKKIGHIFYSDAEERKYTIDFHFTTHRSICPIKKALLLERNDSRHYSEHNYPTWYRSALFCHRPSIESSTTPIARLPWKRPHRQFPPTRQQGVWLHWGFTFYPMFLTSTTTTKR